MPNWLTLGITLTGLALATARLSGVGLGAAFAGFLLGLALMLPGHLIGATGAGDVKLFAALGALLGPRRDVLRVRLHGDRGRRARGGRRPAAADARRDDGADGHARPQPAARMSRRSNGASTNNRFAYAPAIAIGALVAALGF